jgi:hypothetical protein
LLCGRSYDLMDVQGDQRPKMVTFLFYKDIRHDPRWAEIYLVLNTALLVIKIRV